MEYRLKIAGSEDADFNGIKESGFGGVIFTENFLTVDNLKSAKKRRLKTFLHIKDLCREACLYLDSGGVYEGDLYRVTLETVKSIKEKIGGILDMLDGFVIPAPFIKGLLWNNEFPPLYEEIYGRDIKEDLPAIFDEDTQNAEFRVWYYNACASALFFSYILPLAEYMKTLGKKACFDFGNGGRCIDLIKKQLNPFLLQNNKIPIIYETKEGITLVCGKEKYKQNLLVLPLMGIMRSFPYGTNYSRQESPLVLALAEEEYFKSSMKKCEIEYSAVSEIEFLRMKPSELRSFENIIICNSCELQNADLIETLKNLGYKINEKELLDILDKAN